MAVNSCGIACDSLLAYLISCNDGNVGSWVACKMGDDPSAHSVSCEFLNGSCHFVDNESAGSAGFVSVWDFVGGCTASEAGLVEESPLYPTHGGREFVVVDVEVEFR